MLSDNDNRKAGEGDGESPEFKFRSRQGDDDKMRDGGRKRGNGADSLQELLKNTKFENTANQKEFMGDGISPDKKRRQQKPEDKETQ